MVPALPRIFRGASSPFCRWQRAKIWHSAASGIRAKPFGGMGMAETALITGASSGLGLQYARLFAADKKDLVVVARRKERLEALAGELSAAHGVTVTVIAADLADPAAPRRIVDEVKARGLEIEYLVNNAGFGTSGAFAESEPVKALDM